MDPVTSNVVALLSRRARLHPDRTALIEHRAGQPRRLSFGELEDAVKLAAGALHRRGVSAGDRVLVFVPMSIDLYVTVLACWWLGAAVVFVDAWADRQRLEHALGLAEPRAFIGTPKAQWLRWVSPALRRVPIRLVATPAWWTSESRGASPADTPEPAEGGDDEPALITLTTGTTGPPKAAVRTHSFLLAQHRALESLLHPQEGDVDMPTLPIFVLSNLASGITTVLPNFDPRKPAEIDPGAIYRQLTAEGVTTASGSPAFFEHLANWCAREGCHLPLRTLHTGGGPVRPPLARLLRDTVEGETFVVYGSTEVEPVSCVSVGEMLGDSSAGRPDHARGLCVGRPLGSLDVRLIRAHDGPVRMGVAGWAEWEVDPGRVGEVVVDGAHVLPGYWSAEATDTHKIADGGRLWHRTGDGARMDEEGRLWLMGRVRQRVRRKGQDWWPLPVEMAAANIPPVSHACYFGTPEGAFEQQAVLCVETPGGRLPESQRQRLLTALAPSPVDRLVVVPEIPRDPRHASKTDLDALRKLLG